MVDGTDRAGPSRPARAPSASVRWRARIEGIIDADQRRLSAIDGKLELIESALVIETASEQGLLARTGSLFEFFLRLGPLGRELIAALHQRGDGGFDFLHVGPAEHALR